LLPESKALELLETVLFCCTVYDGILQKVFSHAGYVGCGFDASAATCVFGIGRLHCVFEFPRVSALIVDQAGVIVALVKILQTQLKISGSSSGRSILLLCASDLN